MTFSVNDLLVGPVVPAAGVTLISIDFYFEAAAHLEVYISGSNTPLTLGVDYMVTLPSAVNATDGAITLTTAADGVASYAIYGKQPLERQADIQFRGDFRAEVINLEFDRIWRAISGIDTDLERVSLFSRTSDIPNPLETSSDATRIGKSIGFTPDGSGLALVTNADGAITVPPSSVDNAVVRWDGTAAGSIQSSPVTIDDAGAIFAAGLTLEASSSSLFFIDSDTGVQTRVFIDNSGTLVFDVDRNNAVGGSLWVVDIDDVRRLYMDTSGNLRVGDGTAPSVSFEVAGTDAILVPSGTTAQRPAGTTAGRLRYNSQLDMFEAYTTAAGWSGFGTEIGAVAEDVLPATDATYDLGSGSFRFVDAWFSGTVRAANYSDGASNVPASALIDGTAKAFFAYDQTAPNADKSYNISSTTDQAAGLFTWAYTSNFNDAVYAMVSATGSETGQVTGSLQGRGTTNAKATSGWGASTFDNSSALADRDGNGAAFFGDLA
ncbi:hypothetical protein DVVG_00010 [Dunaliella viridis virus SI2]|uniref:hypothetical protein n=1 Tax=Dunaliella viridis virus SI2 TaxID=754069 RepID=UPI0002C064DA|nr:hypothetical protein DVVG_00010 [Dunaliella viridis virus SI2]AGH15996.1 hypothetical protein DVVG_00010 [Dunaliella viridis virus SI2]